MGVTKGNTRSLGYSSYWDNGRMETTISWDYLVVSIEGLYWDNGK